MPLHDHCCVYDCNNRRSRRPDLSFHVFPADPACRRRWVQAIKRVEDKINFQVTSNVVVCSDHFKPECFYSGATTAAEPGKGKYRRLRPGSVPSLFTFRPQPKERPSADDRRNVAAVRVLDAERRKSLPQRRHGESEAEFGLRIQLESERKKNVALEMEVQCLKTDMTKLKSQLFRYANVKEDAAQLEFLTGLSPEIWDSVWAVLKPSDGMQSQKSAAKELEGRQLAPGGGRKPELSLEDEMMMTLVRLRLGRLEGELAYMFRLDIGTVSRIINKCLSFMYLRFGMIPMWPKWEDVERTMPEVFRQKYPDTFIIIDATELRVEKPSSLSQQSQLYSAYKSHCTVKGLLGIAPNGTISFVSALYSGSISDRQLVMDSGLLPLLDHIPPGKNVMADRGFEIQDLLVKPELILNLPPFKGSKTSMTAADVIKTQKIASVRIHVERAIGRVKSRFHIFDKDIPLTLLGSVNQMWAICCTLSNFFGPLIIENK